MESQLGSEEEKLNALRRDFKHFIVTIHCIRSTVVEFKIKHTDV